MDPTLAGGVVRITIEAATPDAAQTAGRVIAALWPTTSLHGPHPVPGHGHGHMQARLYAKPGDTNGET